MWTMIAAVIKLLVMFLAQKIERDKEKKQKQTNAIKAVTAAIKSRNPSEITKAFDRAKRS